jgi:hypothetical protein
MPLVKRRDWALYAALAAIFLAACAIPAFFSLSSRANGAGGELFLEIIEGGRAVRSIALSELGDGEVLELRPGGGVNDILAASDGIRMISSDCPGGDCLRMPPIGPGGGVIVCAPHKLVLKVRQRGEGQGDRLDAVAY